VACDDLFHVFAEVFVEPHLRVPLFQLAKDPGDRPPAARLRADHRHRPVILLDNDIDALPHLFQHGVEIASCLCLAPAHRSHRLQYCAIAAARVTSSNPAASGAPTARMQ
jgi:hypothetical protein